MVLCGVIINENTSELPNPALYGANLRLKRTFVAVLMGATLSETLAGLAGVIYKVDVGIE